MISARRLIGFVGAAAASGAALCFGGSWREPTPPDAKASDVRFDRDIRPILSDRCFQCHGPDPAKRRAELRLDLREEALRDLGGAFAIVPGDPGESELIRRITSTHEDEVMPPPSSHKRPLSQEEQELIRRWIAQGAEYEPHWSFVAPVKGAVPAVADGSWPRNEIDRFILARMEQAKVSPSPEADKATLLRRVLLDLTGLPPTPEELDAFLADTSADAYDKWVDRILTQEPYRSRMAERLASPWCDAARYGDTNGIHTDAGRQMWLWRDWVLEAFRDGMPFDRFITEQIAGDLIENASESQKIATGFCRNHVMTDEGGAIPEEYLAEYAADRTMTMSSVFLGLTVGCARCHDHKFDPITTEDFYSLTAFFNSIEEPGLYSQLPDSNRAFEPFISVPTPRQRELLEEISRKSGAAREQLTHPDPAERTAQEAFVAGAAREAGVAWAESRVVGAASQGGATAEIGSDNSVRFTGKNPDREQQEITLTTNGSGLRLVLLEALADPQTGKPGRFGNGNAVLTGVSVSVSPAGDSQSPGREVPLVWAWADHSQMNGDFDITNALNGGDDRGWALDAHNVPGGRVALFLAGEAFGDSAGSSVKITLKNDSRYTGHSLARVRIRLGTISDAALDKLPLAASRWRIAGPFPFSTDQDRYDKLFGPEEGQVLDLKRNFGFGNQYWQFAPDLADGRVNPLASGNGAIYTGKMVYAPSRREVRFSLGSDDGFQLYIAGQRVTENRTERSVQADQDKATAAFPAGPNGLVLKIVNTGGDSGSYLRMEESPELAGDLVAAILPPETVSPELKTRVATAWGTVHSPKYREAAKQLAELGAKQREIEGAVPRTMVMKELATPRPTFVLSRGQYDQPDKSRPVTRRPPTVLGALPEGAPQNRLGLAQWLTSPTNPLTARIAVNRVWELLFGVGIVKTSEDFGLQGEWPSHPELLDYMAVTFRENGWDLKRLIRDIVTSATYRQDSKFRPELAELDPENRLLARYPRRRLAAEQVRDLALSVSGLLVERVGGPSVKPPQPPGLWQEVAMPASNTKEYIAGMGDDVHRRSLYTYWKRACPPPTMQAFDAPTRESCVVRRANTNTPLQALVLWNDEQFVEAARTLAGEAMTQTGSDAQRAAWLFRRCTARVPEEAELNVIIGSLNAFRDRYRADTASAEKLVAAAKTQDAPELASWTMVASGLISLHETLTQR